MRSFLFAGAAMLALSQVAVAQTANHTENDSSKPAASNQQMRSNLRSMLEKSGYQDIRVAPSSFLVHAKDSDGNPVTMSVSPDSFTEVTDLNHGDTSSHSTTGRSDASTGSFVAVSNSDDLSSRVVGLDIYNNSNQDIGQIKDIALNQSGRAQAYVVSVGGFLGVGEHYVAVSPSALKISYNDSDKKWHAAMNASADQLKAAPEFKYTGRWDASKT